MRSPAQRSENDDPPIVILGGGFAGLFTALHRRNLDDCSSPQLCQSEGWVTEELWQRLPGLNATISGNNHCKQGIVL